MKKSNMKGGSKYQQKSWMFAWQQKSERNSNEKELSKREKLSS